jgi:hypothetical protein
MEPLAFFQPFPMNPSFRPPAPVSDALRTKMYKEYMQNPQENNVRVLSQRYHLSLKRVDAILRLKGQEEEWLKVRFCFRSPIRVVDYSMPLHDD